MEVIAFLLSRLRCVFRFLGVKALSNDPLALGVLGNANAHAGGPGVQQVTAMSGGLQPGLHSACGGCATAARVEVFPHILSGVLERAGAGQVLGPL